MSVTHALERRCPASAGPRAGRDPARGADPAVDDAPADRRRELHLARRAGRARLPAGQQVRRGISRRPAPRRLRDRRRRRARSPWSGRRRCSAPSTPTCSPTPGLRPCWPPTPRCCAPATPSSPSACPTAATSRTARPPTSPAAGSTSSGTGWTRRPGSSTTSRCATLARTHRPKAIVCGSIAYPRHIDYAALPRGRRRGGRVSHRRRRPPHRARRRGSGAQSGAVRRRRLRHHAQGAARAARRHDPVRRASSPSGSTGRSSRSPRAARRCTPSPPRPSRSARRRHRPSRRTPIRWSPTRGCWRPSWPPRGCVVTTGGTDTHLITADPAPLGVDGRTARGRLAAAGMVLDCCALPHADARGLRLGTAAVTTQGMGEAEMARIAALLRGGAAAARSRASGPVKKCGSWSVDFRRIRPERG